MVHDILFPSNIFSFCDHLQTAVDCYKCKLDLQNCRPLVASQSSPTDIIDCQSQNGRYRQTVANQSKEIVGWPTTFQSQRSRHLVTAASQTKETVVWSLEFQSVSRIMDHFIDRHSLKPVQMDSLIDFQNNESG